MHDEFRSALIASARRVFQTLLRIDLDVPPLRAGPFDDHGPDVTAEVDVWGEVEGAVMVRMGPTMARRVTAILTGAQSMDVDKRTMDVVGELTGMVTEGALGDLGVGKFTASSPTIRLLADDEAEFDSHAAPIRIRCGCECGLLTITASLRATPSGGDVRHAAPVNVVGAH